MRTTKGHVSSELPVYTFSCPRETNKQKRKKNTQNEIIFCHLGHCIRIKHLHVGPHWNQRKLFIHPAPLTKAGQRRATATRGNALIDRTFHRNKKIRKCLGGGMFNSLVKRCFYAKMSPCYFPCRFPTK